MRRRQFGSTNRLAAADDGFPSASQLSLFMSVSSQLDVVISSDTSQGSAVQDQILSMLEARKFSDRDLFGVKLALEEAVVNAIKHGNQLDPDKTVRITCEVSDQCAVITIEDQGPGFDPFDIPDPTDDENLEKASGRGLMLMRAFMTNITYNERGNRVCMEKVRTVEE